MHAIRNSGSAERCARGRPGAAGRCRPTQCRRRRLRRDLRPRRPQHRLGGDERPHFRARRLQRPLRQDRRCSSARRAAACGSRSTAARRSSRCSTSSRCSRSARSRSTRHIRRTSGSVPARPGRATASRSATASTSPPTAARPGRTWACRIRSASPGSSSTRATPTPFTPACPGKLWSDSADRGLYKTTDGGQSWQLVLKGANLSTGCGSVTHGPRQSGRALRRPVGLPPQGLDVPLRRRRPEGALRQRPVSHRGRRQDLDRAHARRATRGCRPSPTAASRSRLRRATPRRVYAFIESTDSALYISHDGGATWERGDKSQWMVWRPFYFANLVVDPKNPESRLQDRRRADRERGRRQELQHRRRLHRHARRRARRLDRSGQLAARVRGRRRRPVDFLRRRQQVVEDRQPAGLAVLPRQRRRRGSLPRLRRPAGQQLLGRRFEPIRAASPTRAGKTCTAATASGCSWIRPIRTTCIAETQGGHHRAASTCARHETRDIQPKLGDRGPQALQEAALQLEHADRAVAARAGDDLHRRPVPVPLARSRPDLGAHLAGSDHQRSGEAEAGAVGRRHRRQFRGRDAHDDLLDQRVAARSRDSSGWAPTTATCS